MVIKMEFEIQKWYKKIPHRDKKIFFITFATLLLAHAFRLTNHLPNHDCLWNYYGELDVVTLGRWTLTYAAGISSYFDLQWLNGLLCIIYLSLAGVLLARLFEVKNIFLACLGSILLGVYPTMCCTFMYMYTADAYCLAMLLATLAAWFMTSTDWKRRLVGSVVLGVAMGIYQVYVSYALVLCIIWLLKKTLVDDIKSVENKLAAAGSMKGLPVWRCVWNLLYSGVIGAVVYVVGLYTRLAGRQLSSYQGIGDATLVHSVGWYVKTAAQTYLDIYRLLFINDAYGNTFIGYIMLALALLVGVWIGAKCIVLLKQKKWTAVLWVLFLIAALPIAVYCLKVLSEGAVYHRLMVQSAALVWMLPIILLDNVGASDKEGYSAAGGGVSFPRGTREGIIKIFANLMILMMLVQTGNYIVGANINYLAAHMSYEKSQAFCNRIVARLESLDYSGKSFLIAGTLDTSKYQDANMLKATEAMTGVPNGIIPYTNAIYIRMINQYIGGNYTELTDTDTINTIINSREYEEMDCWPGEDSVAVMDDVVVVKLSE